MKLTKGDNVKVILGKDSGKIAKITKVLPKTDKIFVEGVNIYKRHVSGKRQGINEAGILDIQKPINISNVMLVCPNCKRPTRVGFKLEVEKKIRICRRCHKAVG